jgi:hypothetical protein
VDGTPDFAHEQRPADAHRDNLKPPTASWWWQGLIRQADGVWRPVALARTLAACWDALLTYPGKGDLLCIPTRPPQRGRGPQDDDPGDAT